MIEFRKLYESHAEAETNNVISLDPPGPISTEPEVQNNSKARKWYVYAIVVIIMILLIVMIPVWTKFMLNEVEDLKKTRDQVLKELKDQYRKTVKKFKKIIPGQKGAN